MEKKESGTLLKWWTNLVVKNPRSAIAGGCGIIIMFLGLSVYILNKEKSELYRELIDYKDSCSDEKLKIIYGAIGKQDLLNIKYELKVEDLYKQLTVIRGDIKTKKEK